jgi:CxxC motif-containing protein
MRKEIVCIGCPLGCPLTVDHNQKTVQKISGNRCNLGSQYAEKELFNPERTLTTTVKVKNGHLPLVSVRTSTPIPKKRLFDAMNLLAKIEVEAPIKIGDIILQNLFDTNASIVATKNILKRRKQKGTRIN